LVCSLLVVNASCFYLLADHPISCEIHCQLQCNDQVPTNLQIPNEFLWTAVITDYAVPTYVCNCLFVFFLLYCFFFCSLLVVNESLCCCQLANACRITLDYQK
jgi:hypothetical protein